MVLAVMVLEVGFDQLIHISDGQQPFSVYTEN